MIQKFIINKSIGALLMGLLLLSLFSSCVSVQAYQRVYLNDEDMQLGARKVEMFEGYFQTYREGASGANGSKTGGGCGCN